MPQEVCYLLACFVCSLGARVALTGEEVPAQWLLPLDDVHAQCGRHSDAVAKLLLKTARECHIAAGAAVPKDRALRFMGSLGELVLEWQTKPVHAATCPRPGCLLRAGAPKT
jgi:hypothetical protein